MTIVQALIVGALSMSLSCSPVAQDGVSRSFTGSPEASSSVYIGDATDPGEKFPDEVSQLAYLLTEARASLDPGESVLVREGETAVMLTMTESGLAVSPYVANGLSRGATENSTQGICHSLAMAAVYAIGSALFAAAA